MLRTPAARLLLAAVLAAPLAGCITPYRMDVQQGNVISQEMVDQLKPGMTKAQVRFVLGTPLITDPFHPDRWDYFYSFRHGREGVPETRRLTVIFRNDTLVRVEGDLAARDREVADTAAGDERSGISAGRQSNEAAVPPERADFAPAGPRRTL